MDRLIATNTVDAGHADTAPVSGTPGYATDGNPAVDIPATRFPAYAFNAIQEEIIGVILDAGITLDKTNNAQLLAAINSKLAAYGRIRLSADTTFYVATTGNDTTGDGTALNPWATVQKAWNIIGQFYDLAGYNVTIQMADGTYAAGLNAFQGRIGQYQGNKITLQGNAAFPANVIVSPTAGTALTISDGAHLALQNFKVQAAAGGGINVVAGFCELGVGMEFGTCAGAHMLVQNSGTLSFSANYKITGSATMHYQGYAGGSMTAVGSHTVTLTGTPNFSVAFTDAGLNSAVDVAGTTFTGGATGTRYNATLGGVINSAGGGANYFPGNAAGSTASGGQYA